MSQAVLQEILGSLQQIQKDMKDMVRKDDLKKFATKDDLKSFVTKDYLDRRLENYATKEDLETMNSNLITHIDGFIGMYQRTDVEIVALRSKCHRLESHVNQLAKHTDLTLT